MGDREPLKVPAGNDGQRKCDDLLPVADGMGAACCPTQSGLLWKRMKMMSAGITGGSSMSMTGRSRITVRNTDNNPGLFFFGRANL
jgi:hypothetical protein